jgi:hypothetical protein
MQKTAFMQKTFPIIRMIAIIVGISHNEIPLKNNMMINFSKNI